MDEEILTEEEINQIKEALLNNTEQAIKEDVIPIETRIFQLAQAVAEIPKNEAITIQQAYTRAFALLHYIDYYLDQYPRKVAYITNTGNIYTAPLIAMADHIDNNYRIIHGSRGMEKMLTQEMKELLSQDHIDKVKAAFNGTVNRLNRFYARAKEQGLFSTKQSGFLLYKNQSNQWQGQRVLNFGDVKEAYFAAMLDRSKTSQQKFKQLSPGADQFKSHELISYFAQKYLYNVSNASSVGGEDVNSKILSAQYAVKGKGASAPNLQQYITFAESIINKNPKQKLQNMLKTYLRNEQQQNQGLRNLVLSSTYRTKKELEEMVMTTLSQGGKFEFK